NKRTREIFGQDFVFHDLRALYAQLAFVMFAPPNMSQIAFISQVLGHKENSLTTGLSYTKFVLKKERLHEIARDPSARVTDIEAKLQALLLRQEELAAE